MNVPDKSVVTYIGTWTPTQTMGAASIVTAVSTDLTANGINVRDASSNAGFTQNSEIPFVLNISPFRVTLTLQVENGLGFGSEADVISIVRHWVYQETGIFPVTDTIPQVQVPGAAPSDTGQPNPPKPPDGGIGDSLSKLFDGLSSTVQLGVAAAIVGALIIGGLALHKEVSR